MTELLEHCKPVTTALQVRGVQQCVFEERK